MSAAAGVGALWVAPLPIAWLVAESADGSGAVLEAKVHGKGIKKL